ncbi:alpha/beta-hydrolase [Mollisia scopiformis]|uniref:Alpha/beta-hydrolase n=1 Tax=Mollisia scopiformis TaxID=149040 RepID=A0A194WWN6_MOLSC|nr:alpha/beta-hydrolase [Mollisia scopiformis]KUJ12391.1 alpha/beta-hydrolase [Mollisia scopiformis]
MSPPKVTKDLQEFFYGAAESPTVKPVAVGGVWYPSLYSVESDSNKKVILHFHGGAYVLGGARQSECGFGADILVKTHSAMVFCPQYRLACYDNGQFPAALQDALISYKYLLDQGIPASRIVVSGDSAGGNLALALLRYLSDQNDSHQLPLPSAVLLWGPWLDLSVDPESIDRNKNSATDYITSSLARWGVESFVPLSMSSSHPYISPARNVFSTNCPIFIQVGGGEILHDEIVTFADKMKESRGNRIELHDTPFAPHDILLCGELLGWEKEAEQAAQASRVFLESQGI